MYVMIASNLILGLFFYAYYIITIINDELRDRIIDEVEEQLDMHKCCHIHYMNMTFTLINDIRSSCDVVDSFSFLERRLETRKQEVEDFIKSKCRKQSDK